MRSAFKATGFPGFSRQAGFLHEGLRVRFLIGRLCGGEHGSSFVSPLSPEELAGSFTGKHNPCSNLTGLIRKRLPIMQQETGRLGLVERWEARRELCWLQTWPLMRDAKQEGDRSSPGLVFPSLPPPRFAPALLCASQAFSSHQHLGKDSLCMGLIHLQREAYASSPLKSALQACPIQAQDVRALAS